MIIQNERYDEYYMQNKKPAHNKDHRQHKKRIWDKKNSKPTPKISLTTNKHIGTLSISGRGVGYVRIAATSDKIEIEPRLLSTALNGDLVNILIHPQRANAPLTGEILSIEKRSKRGFAGIVNQKDGVFTLTPHDYRDSFQMIISKENIAGAEGGNYVFGIITDWTTREEIPRGKIVEVLGESATHDARMKGIALERGFSSNFPASVEAEAHTIEEKVFNSLLLYSLN